MRQELFNDEETVHDDDDNDNHNNSLRVCFCESQSQEQATEKTSATSACQPAGIYVMQNRLAK